MKKLLLSFIVLATGLHTNAQVICAGVSPANIAGNYDFSWSDPAGGWGSPDFNIPGTFVQGTLMLIDDGTPGTNAQGNPISAEGCAGADPATYPNSPGASTSWNDLTGQIAVIYRNTCDFGWKALQAELNGAIGAIIINREPEVIAMGATTSETQPIAKNAEHDDGTPLNCAYVEENFLNGFLSLKNGDKLGVTNPNQTWGSLDDADGDEETELPSMFESAGNVLKVSWFIRDAGTGIEFGNDAEHLENFGDEPMITNHIAAKPSATK